MAEESLTALLRSRASANQSSILERAVGAAESSGVAIFLVGGVIRDLLITGRLHDIDLTVEGDGIGLATRLAEDLDARLEVHRRFLTAEITVADERIDVVTARREFYPRPARLPEVEPGSIADDLSRRDFSVNAMALRLWPDADDRLIDPYGGRKDLGARRLEVLHELSFQDDPTRIVRGARLGSRLGMDFGPSTAALAAAAISGGAFEPLSGFRLRRELALVMQDDEPAECLRRLDALGFYSVLARAEPFTASDLERLESVFDLAGRVGPEVPWPDAPVRWWQVGLMALFLSASETTRKALAERLSFEGELARAFVGLGERLNAVTTLADRSGRLTAEFGSALESLSAEETVLLRAVSTAEVQQMIDRWLREWEPLRLGIGGEDLIAQGFASGPQIGRALRSTLEARRAGRIAAAEELDFAISVLKEGMRDKAGQR